MALTPEEIQAAAQAQAELNRLIKEYNSLTGQSITNPINPKDFQDASSYAKTLNNEIVKFTRINKDSQKELGDAIDSLNSSLKEYEKATGKPLKNRINPNNYKTAAAYAKALKEEQSKINSLLLNAESGLNSISSRFADIGKELKAGFGNSTNSAMKSVNKIYSLTEQLFDIQQDLTQASAKEVKQQKEKVLAEFDRLNRQLKGLEVQEKENDLAKKRVESELKQGKITEAQATSRLTRLNTEGAKISELKNLAEERSAEFENQSGLIEDINNAYEDTIDRINNINNATGVTGKLLEGVGGSLEKLGFKGIGQSVNDINKKLKEQAVTMTDNGKNVATLGQKFSLLKTGVKSMGSALISALDDPLVRLAILTKAFKALVDIGMHASQAAVDIARNLGQTQAAATESYNQLYKMSVAMDGAFSSASDLVKANQELNAALGTSVVFSSEQLEIQTLLTNQLGLSAGEAANAAKFAAMQGKSGEQIVDGILAQGDGLINNRELVQEVLSVSADTAALYENNPTLIARAVMETKKLGMSLQQAKNIAGGLLDFESSIDAEMEAQLLTGRNMNLGRARELALQGKTAEAAAEARRQIGSYTDYMKQGPLAQQATAKALNMSTEELAEQLRTSELIDQIRRENPGLTQEQLNTEALRRTLSASERLGQSMTTLKESFASIIQGPLSTIVDFFAGTFQKIAESPILKGAVGVVGALVGIGTVALGLIAATKGIARAILDFRKGKVGENPGRPLYAKIVGGAQGLGDSASESMGGGGGYYGDDGRYRDSKTGKYKKDPKKTGAKGPTSRGRKTTPPPVPKTRGGRRTTPPPVPKTRGGRRTTPPPVPKTRGRRGRGLTGALTTAAAMFAPEIVSGMTGGSDMGGELGQTAIQVGTNAAIDTAAQSGGGMMSRLGGKIKDFGKGALGKGGKLISKLNPMKLVDTLKGKIPQIGKGFGSLAKKIPVLGTAVESILTAMDIKSMVQAGGKKEDIYQDIGKRTLQGIGGIMGGVGVTSLTTGLSATGLPAFLLNGLAYAFGDMAGRWVFGQIADKVGAKPIGESISKSFGLEDDIQQANKQQGGIIPTPIESTNPDNKTIKANDFTIQTNPADSLVMAGGTQFGKETNELLRTLIESVKEGGTVYIDGDKAGRAIMMGSYKTA